jgi:hypothetical protein
MGSQPASRNKPIGAFPNCSWLRLRDTNMFGELMFCLCKSRVLVVVEKEVHFNLKDHCTIGMV